MIIGQRDDEKEKGKKLYIDKTVILIIEGIQVIIKKKKVQVGEKRGHQRFKGAVSFN